MKRALVVVFSILGLLSCATGPSKPQDLVDRAVDAMGGADKLAGIKTVWAKGSTKQWEPEQSEVPGGEMRFANEASYQVWQDRSQRAARYDWEKNFAYPAARTYKFSEILTPEAGYVLGVDTTARNAQNMQHNAHSMSSLRLATAQREAKRGAVTGLMLEMKSNPERVSAAPDIVVDGRAYPAASYQGFIVAFDAQTGLPARVRTLDYDNVWGDVNYDTVYSDARAASGLRLQELAPGVQHVVGGTHNALLVEMSDHLIVFDAPVTDLQSKWIIDAAKVKYPGKPIRYLVLTHHHMDHSGGLRAYIAEGAALVVGQGAGEHFRKVLAAPHTRNPDIAARELSGAHIIEVSDKKVFSDGK